jgi:hypothetical protein
MVPWRMEATSRNLVDHGEGGGVGPLGDQDVHGPLAVDQGVAAGDVGRVLDIGHVAQVDVLPRPERDGPQLLGVLEHGVDRDDGHEVLDAGVAGGADGVALVQGGDHLLGGGVVGAQAVGVDADHDGPLVAAERRRGRHAGEAGEHRPDLEQGLVLDLADAPGLALEDQVADGHAAGVEAHHEGRDGARRHEGP